MTSNRMKFWIGAVIVLGVLAAIGGSMNGATGGSGDIYLESICEDFRVIASEADLRTTSELRADLQNLYDSSFASDDPGVRRSARTMLEGITADNIYLFRNGVEAMNTECVSGGF